ncbi:hypothetical protein EDC01DRAFT_633051 [Geopyxis carbonaria]|nr:hypothetical protein EDC01DRAFT_633051 [Geopyxis carbonaria]
MYHQIPANSTFCSSRHGASTEYGWERLRPTYCDIYRWQCFRSFVSWKLRDTAELTVTTTKIRFLHALDSQQIQTKVQTKALDSLYNLASSLTVRYRMTRLNKKLADLKKARQHCHCGRKHTTEEALGERIGDDSEEGSYSSAGVQSIESLPDPAHWDLWGCETEEDRPDEGLTSDESEEEVEFTEEEDEGDFVTSGQLQNELIQREIPPEAFALMMDNRASSGTAFSHRLQYQRGAQKSKRQKQRDAEELDELAVQAMDSRPLTHIDFLDATITSMPFLSKAKQEKLELQRAIQDLKKRLASKTSQLQGQNHGRNPKKNMKPEWSVLELSLGELEREPILREKFCLRKRHGEKIGEFRKADKVVLLKQSHGMMMKVFSSQYESIFRRPVNTFQPTLLLKLLFRAR